MDLLKLTKTYMDLSSLTDEKLKDRPFLHIKKDEGILITNIKTGKLYIEKEKILTKMIKMIKSLT